MPITLSECISSYKSTEESDVTVLLDHKIWSTFSNSTYCNPRSFSIFKIIYNCLINSCFGAFNQHCSKNNSNIFKRSLYFLFSPITLFYSLIFIRLIRLFLRIDTVDKSSRHSKPLPFMREFCRLSISS